MAGTKKEIEGEEIEGAWRTGGRNSVVQNKVPSRQVRSQTTTALPTQTKH